MYIYTLHTFCYVVAQVLVLLHGRAGLYFTVGYVLLEIGGT